MRSLPPDIPTYKPPVPGPLKEGPRVELADDEGEPVPQPAPESQPNPAASPSPSTAEPSEAVPAADPAETAEESAATIVGSWRVTQMLRNGQPSPEMALMEITVTFREDGTAEMSMSNPQVDKALVRTAAYTIDGNAISVDMGDQLTIGTFTLEGDTLTLEMEETKMVLSRQ